MRYVFSNGPLDGAELELPDNATGLVVLTDDDDEHTYDVVDETVGVKRMEFSPDPYGDAAGDTVYPDAEYYGEIRGQPAAEFMATRRRPKHLCPPGLCPDCDRLRAIHAHDRMVLIRAVAAGIIAAVVCVYWLRVLVIP